MEKGMVALLGDAIKNEYYSCASRGCIPLHSLESVEKMYAEYHNLGGNGTITKLVEDMREMPVDNSHADA